eukprot:CAMPEP_0206020194 /NCGR_PEP_ID=MMETSP1464-20131121/30574_1 /ASSEMBLY_ACC=CAM_ASM_001124 /TAXON_ID=119497 /ORGANISM="Exanthemachrysis gayraliae, Strain RCC1523" /LENGTH=46 /DNA_ID= /DNA_START= /DNA_END= /DNA_ORIENTATION=
MRSSLSSSSSGSSITAVLLFGAFFCDLVTLEAGGAALGRLDGAGLG